MKELQFVVNKNGEKLEAALSLAEAEKPGATLKPNEVLVKILAAPINPTDLGTINPPGGMRDFRKEGSAVVQTINPQYAAYHQNIVGKPQFVGSEASGIVIDTGSAATAKKGKLVSFFGGKRSTTRQFTVLHQYECFELNEGTDFKLAAASLVNPLTVVAMLDTAKKEGHKGMVHLAAASNLGKMLLLLCQKENFPIICVVRKPSQEEELKKLGAKYVLNSESPGFEKDLFEACTQTHATCCFDPIAGGGLSGKVLIAMEKGIVANMSQDMKDATPAKYGSSTVKSIYVYGALNPTPATIPLSAGLAWNIRGFLLFHWFGPLSPKEKMAQFKTVADNLTTIFHSKFGKELAFEDVLDPTVFKEMSTQTTGGKVLLLPNGPDPMSSL